VQSKLLRVLEDATVQRIGEGQRRHVDVRVIAATHRPIEEMVNGGGFREDLYHRLSAFQVFAPPLRERSRDVELIAYDMLEQMAPGDGQAREALKKSLDRHRGYMWPGNVRELRNLVRRVAAFGDTTMAMGVAPATDELVSVHVDEPFHSAKDKWISAFERQYLLRLLDESGGNVSEAARRAEMSRMHLTRLIQKHGITRHKR
jgi:DNA-binding NtrC family response regulator